MCHFKTLGAQKHEILIYPPTFAKHLIIDYIKEKAET